MFACIMYLLKATTGLNRSLICHELIEQDTGAAIKLYTASRHCRVSSMIEEVKSVFDSQKVGSKASIWLERSTICRPNVGNWPSHQIMSAGCLFDMLHDPWGPRNWGPRRLGKGLHGRCQAVGGGHQSSAFWTTTPPARVATRTFETFRI